MTQELTDLSDGTSADKEDDGGRDEHGEGVVVRAEVVAKEEEAEDDNGGEEEDVDVDEGPGGGLLGEEGAALDLPFGDARGGLLGSLDAQLAAGEELHELGVGDVLVGEGEQGGGHEGEGGVEDGKVLGEHLKDGRVQVDGERSRDKTHQHVGRPLRVVGLGSHRVGDLGAGGEMVLFLQSGFLGSLGRHLCV